MEIERAKAICTTAQTIIDTARVEVKYMEVTNQGEKNAQKFFGEEPDPRKLPVTISSRRNLPA